MRATHAISAQTAKVAEFKSTQLATTEATLPHDRSDGKSPASAESDAAKPSVERNKAAPMIVIGFVGGYVRKGNAVHSPVKVAASLRAAFREGVHVEVFENHHREEAYQEILQLLGMNGSRAKTRQYKENDEASENGKRAARIIIYGMSWGASETVALARELEQQKIPVLLTIQVDSVRKFGENDGLIPANVAEAVNFYQNDGLLHGRAQIRAADASRTKILGNFHYQYKASPLACKEYPWWDRLLAKYHTNIECDPVVWDRVEGLIRERLPGLAEK